MSASGRWLCLNYVATNASAIRPPRRSSGTLAHHIPRSAPLLGTGALKAGVSPKVISERIGYADVGFFLQTYAHVLKNDDRDAAEHAASFLFGDNWASESDDEQS